VSDPHDAGAPADLPAPAEVDPARWRLVLVWTRAHADDHGRRVRRLLARLVRAATGRRRAG